MAKDSKEVAKPLPKITSVTRPFWEEAKNGRLAVQRCRSCRAWVWCPRPSCGECGSADLQWTQVSGRGTLFSFTVIRQVVGRGARGFERDVPYVVAWVDLEEGVRLCSNLVDCSVEEAKIGMGLEVVFDNVTEEISLPKFKPAGRGRNN